MCNYVEDQLLDDEKLVHRAQVHWAVYIPALLALLISVCVFSPAHLDGVPYAQYAMVAGILGSALLAVGAEIFRQTTDLVVTDRRVIAKYGFIARHTFEVQLSRVEGVNLNQSILGRLLGYAAVDIHGTGGGHVPVPFIKNPEAFRRCIGTRTI